MAVPAGNNDPPVGTAQTKRSNRTRISAARAPDSSEAEKFFSAKRRNGK